MTIEIVITFFALSALVATAYAAYKDFMEMSIPNSISIYIIMAFIAAYTLQVLSKYMLGLEVSIISNITSHLFALGLTFGVTFAMFSFGMIGGGDAKLASALSLWLGLAHIPAFLVIMALVGGVLGVLSIVFKKAKLFKAMPEKSWIARAQKGESVVPYGIALFVAALNSFYKTGYLPL